MLTSGRSQCACVSVVTQAKEKYKKALEELSTCTPQYMEGMELQFEQCQNFEERRLLFVKELLLDVKHHLNLSENQRFETSDETVVVCLLCERTKIAVLFSVTQRCTESLRKPSERQVHRTI